MDGYALSEQTKDQVAALLSGAGALPTPVRPVVADDAVYVMCTSFGSGTGAGTVQVFSANTTSWITAPGTSTVTILPANSETLSTSTRYACLFAGYDAGNNRGQYRVVGGAGGVDSSAPSGTTWQSKTFLTSASCTGDTITTTAESVYVRA